MGSSNSIIPSDAVVRYTERLQEAFRRKGWRVDENPRVGGRRADMAVSKNGNRYLVKLKAASEGRRDHLMPLLAQAILEAQDIAKGSPKPFSVLAVVAAPRIAPAVIAHLERFLAENAPDAAAGFFDEQGLLRFLGPGLEEMNERPQKRSRLKKIALPDSGHLFSDLNQWMLKVLLAPEIPAEMLAAPRGEYRNASQLTEAAQVSLMSAFRFLRQMKQEGFLDDDDEMLRVVRRQEVMRRWQAVYLRSVVDLPARWIVRGGSPRRLADALRSQRANAGGSKPRACLGLFAAADALGTGFVHGVKPHLYVEKLNPEVLKKLGLSAEGAQHAPDVLVRVPLYRESLFRATVECDGVPVADILQVWLDTSAFPTRGAAQADELRSRVLAPLFKKAK
jgi:hypothetical protein